MTNVAFKLEDAGFTREQVEVLTEFMSGSVATKEDIANLRAEVKEDIANLRAEVKENIANLRAEVKEDIVRLEGMIEAQGERFNGKFLVLYWMLGLIILAETMPYLKAFFG